eukprot:NODE_543_length_6231_cov_0.300718.p8 type:complete len:102 gc:universal NODE_543_length_6231_cov_0.300718:4702-4397(-)
MWMTKYFDCFFIFFNSANSPIYYILDNLICHFLCRERFCRADFVPKIALVHVSYGIFFMHIGNAKCCCQLCYQQSHQNQHHLPLRAPFVQIVSMMSSNKPM